MSRALIVVDMQNDFIDETLGSNEAEKIVENVCTKIKSYTNFNDKIFVTMDTHDKNYLKTEEGLNLPVEHCIVNTNGWELNSQVSDALKEAKNLSANPTDRTKFIMKPTFGSLELGNILSDSEIDTIELVGLCTDICVLSNAVIAKAALPNAHIVVDAACCAGVSPESHDTALSAMSSLQIEVLNQNKEPWR